MIDRNISTPIYLQVKKNIVKFIKEKPVITDRKLPTEFQFAKKYRVDRLTIRRALDELEKEEILYRVRPKGTFLTPKADSILSSTVQQNKTLTLLTDMSVTDFFVHLAKAFEDEITRRGYSIDIRSVYSKGKYDPGKYSEVFKDSVPRAVIMAPLTDELDDIYFQLAERNIPFVIIDKNIKGLKKLKADFVGLDNFEGAYIAVKYLIESGHRRIACITNKKVSPCINRFEGYKKALEDSNIRFDPSLVIEGDIPPEGSFIESTRELLRRENKVTAVFAFCDLAAVDVYKACKELGKNIPQDISIIGFDDLPFARMLEVPLTTVEQPLKEIARISIDLLVEKISGASNYVKHVILQPKLVIRQSVSKSK